VRETTQVDAQRERLESALRLLTDTCLGGLEKEAVRCHSSLEKLASWLEKGRRGESLTIVSTACPAYSYVKPEGAPAHYTYSSLAGDVGLAGARFFRSIDSVHRLFRQDLGVSNFRHEVLVADFEGFTRASLGRIGITAMDFNRRCWETACAYQSRGATRIRATTFSNMFGGRERWMRELTEMMHRATVGEFPALLDKECIRSVGQERRATFEALFREPIADGDMEQVVVNRAIELGTAGKLICGLYRNPLILSISDEQFAKFFGLAADAPILDMSGIE
jgi:hypothetical protein